LRAAMAATAAARADMLLIMVIRFVFRD